MRAALHGLGLCTCTVAIVAFCGGCPMLLGEQPPASDNDNIVTGDATSGEQLFATPRPTEGGTELACAGCHADDGSGNIGPDIRGADANHLQEHAQGDGAHFEGVKFSQLTAENFADIAAYLAEQCEAGADCIPGEDDHDHDGP